VSRAAHGACVFAGRTFAVIGEGLARRGRRCRWSAVCPPDRSLAARADDLGGGSYSPSASTI